RRAAPHRPGDSAAVITFARDPHIAAAFGEPLPDLGDTGRTDGTNVAAALQLARSELDTYASQQGKRIVLLSDGNENEGTSVAETAGLAADGISLDTVLTPTRLRREALISSVESPSRARIGEPFVVRVIVSSLTSQTASVVLSSGSAGAGKQVQLHPGKTVVQFRERLNKSGFYRFEARLTAPQDTFPENHVGETAVWVRGRPAVLYVADSPDPIRFLRNALRRENIDVAYCTPARLPADPAAYQVYDSVFLSNVPADALSSSQMLALQSACRDFGLGLGMVGGDSSFGAGGYRGTPLEEALPVSMNVRKRKRLPSVAIALVIEDLEIPSSVNMSIEAAKATMDLLEPIDQVGVLDCSGPDSFGSSYSTSPSGRWRIPMQHVTDRNALKARMQGLTDMGDPPSYDPFLMEAARVLNSTDARVKHLVFLGDGDAIYEGANSSIAANAQRIRNMGITLSTIASGADAAGIRFLAGLAYVGGGHAYVADRPDELPRLLLRDEQTISEPPIIEEPFQPKYIEGDEVLNGIGWSGAPPLLGYNVTISKPG
ncbi:MAG TPA: VWA domain-containing protein, partial [Chthonomonadales bacterium]|nr:VWA domain-containing protein [Chthonomonadales bacterium]